MIEVHEVRDAGETIARAFEEYKSINDQRLAEIEKKRSSDVLIGEQLARMDTTINKLQDDISGVKTAIRRPAHNATGESVSVPSEYKQAFMRYVTKGYEADMASLSTKALQVINNAEGGFMVPPEFSDRIVTRQFETTPMRKLATVMTISSDAVEMLRDTNEPAAQWVSELAPRNETNDNGLGRIRIPVCELFAQPKATQKLLDDSVINVEEWLVNKVADKFARAENAAFVSGNGVNQPRGFTSYAASSVNDNTRPWGTLQYTATGQNGGFVTGNNSADCLLTIMNQLRAGYLANASWIMPRAVADLIRKMKNTNTQSYIWQPGLQAGMPASLLGYPVVLGEEMPAVANGSYSVAFGNFKEGYTIVDRMGMQILRDPYTGAPFIKFRCSKRTGGDVVNFEAIKLLSFSAS